MSEFDISSYMHEIAAKYGFDPSEVRKVAETAQRFTEPVMRRVDVGDRLFDVTRMSMGPILTEHGRFYQMNFSVDDDWRMYHALVNAEIDSGTTLPAFNPDADSYLRIDSGCATGQLYLDKTCECKDQLEVALKELAVTGQGAIIHIPEQDGRGRGLDFKLGTLYLQELLGVNTVESFTMLGNDPSPEALDARTYDGAVAVLKFMDFPNDVLMATNNPKKLDALENVGYRVDRSPIIIEGTDLTSHHLDAKKGVLGHMS